ncbi:MAG: RnfH family protein [Rhodocyclaceae bacterium]|nr:RnfH family protein [Rhodocyclaceae bacterium]
MTDPIRVEVVYALPERQEVVTLNLAAETTAEQAILASGLLEKYPEISLDKTGNKIGIYAKLAPLTTVLRDRDRVEIYRPLIADPKEVRRKRAKEGKAMTKGGGDEPGTEAAADSGEE